MGFSHQSNNLHSKIRDINIVVDKLVIGSSLEALTYAYINDAHLCFSNLMIPWRFDYFEASQDLSLWSLENKIEASLTSLDSKTRCLPKAVLWEHLFLCLSLAGNIPTSFKISSMRLQDKTVKAITRTSRMAKFNFNELIIFDEASMGGIKNAGNFMSDKCEVRDWFNVRSGMKHQYDYMENTEDFVNHIFFYPSDRIDGNHDLKDAVTVSYLTQEQINSFEFSDINARFKTLHMMKRAGIRGARNGRDQLNKLKYKYYSIKIENVKRDIILPRRTHKSYENIKFNYDSFDDIIQNNSFKESNASRLSRRINRY